MERLVYVPKVEAYIRCDGEGQGRIVDLTEDIVNGTLTRRVDAMSTVELTLQNKFGRYTGGSTGTGGPNAVRIRPMDRIIVRMSRVTEPFLTFSGYVDESPFYQLYPGTINIAASCSLKLIANTYFDPGLPFLQNYFQQFGWLYDYNSGTLMDGISTAGANKRFGYLDVAGGVGDVITHVLHDIGNWPTEAILIDSLPTDFLSRVTEAMNADLTQDATNRKAAEARLKKFLGTTSSATPSTTDPSANPQTGNVAMEDVARLALAAGVKGDNLVLAVAIARAESGLKSDAQNYNTNLTYDWGLWQINTVHAPGATGGGALPAPGSATPFPAWGTTFKQQMFTPKLNAAQMLSISSSGTTWTPWSTFNNGAYKQYLDEAKAAVQAAVLAPSTATVDTTTAPTTTVRQKTAAETGSTIATNIVKIALGEVGTSSSGGRDNGPAILKYQKVTGAIGEAWCGSFLSWVYQQAGMPLVGTKFSGPASVQNIVDTAKANGWTTNDPQPADIIAFDGPGVNDHVAIVTARSGSNLSVVGGNQGAGVVSQGQVAVGGTWGIGTPVYIRVPGVGTAAADVGLTGGTDTGAASTSDATSAGLQGGWAILQTQSNNSTLSILLTGKRAIANDISLLGWISQITKGSGRSFMSTPDGRFFAFFPDYFNAFGASDSGGKRKATPYFRINDIELVDFTINENDTELTTHMFGVAPINSGQIGGMGEISTVDQQNSQVASVESDAFKFFISINPSDPRLPRDKDGAFDSYAFLRRYGARPMPKEYPDIAHPALLWIATWMDFTQQWAKTYSATASTTFLPELFPGTVVEVGESGGVTMYVEEVTHTFSRESGFETSAQLTSPATISGVDGMVTSGSFDPERYTTGQDFYGNQPNG